MKCVKAHFYYGGGPYPISESELKDAPVPPTDFRKLGEFVTKVEQWMSKHSGGHALRVDAVNFDEYHIFMQGNGFSIRYEQFVGPNSVYGVDGERDGTE